MRFPWKSCAIRSCKAAVCICMTGSLVLMLSWALAGSYARGGPAASEPSEPQTATPKSAQEGVSSTDSIQRFSQSVSTWKRDLDAAIGKAVQNDLGCFFQLRDAIRLDAVARWQREDAKMFLRILAQDEKAKHFLGTVDNWQLLARRSDRSIREKYGEAPARIRMVEVRLTLPMSEQGGGTYVQDAGEMLFRSEAETVLAEMTDEYLPQHSQLRGSDESQKQPGNTEGPTVFFQFQLHFVRQPTSHTTPGRQVEAKMHPEAQVWVVYEILQKPPAGQPTDAQLVEHLEIHSHDMTYDSGTWMIQEVHRQQ